jgi:hypothetical protein
LTSAFGTAVSLGRLGRRQNVSNKGQAYPPVT